MGHQAKNQHIISIVDGEEAQVNGIDQLFSKIIKENFPEPRKDTPVQTQEVHRTPNSRDQKRKAPWHITVKALNRLSQGPSLSSDGQV